MFDDEYMFNAWQFYPPTNWKQNIKFNLINKKTRFNATHLNTIF